MVPGSSGRGSKYNDQGPQVLVFGSIYQGSIFGTHFDPQPNGHWMGRSEKRRDPVRVSGVCGEVVTGSPRPPPSKVGVGRCPSWSRLAKGVPQLKGRPLNSNIWANSGDASRRFATSQVEKVPSRRKCIISQNIPMSSCTCTIGGMCTNIFTCAIIRSPPPPRANFKCVPCENSLFIVYVVSFPFGLDGKP